MTFYTQRRQHFCIRGIGITSLTCSPKLVGWKPAHSLCWDRSWINSAPFWESPGYLRTVIGQHIIHNYPITPGYMNFSWSRLHDHRTSEHMTVTQGVSGFGGLGVSVLASGTQVRGFKLGRSRRIFKGGKFLSTLSFGREVKPWVPWRSFAACKRTLNVPWKSAFRQNSRSYSPIISSNFRR
jgi:hypothetical protein